jgi:hypothetical protein
MSAIAVIVRVQVSPKSLPCTALQGELVAESRQRAIPPEAAEWTTLLHTEDRCVPGYSI